MTKKELFLQLAKPDENGVSRWVAVTEFTGQYSDLKLGNGGSWLRATSSLAKEYIVETDKTITSGVSIDAIRLNGFNEENVFSQAIRQDIKDYYKNQRCVMLGVRGISENTKKQVKHGFTCYFFFLRERLWTLGLAVAVSQFLATSESPS